MNLRQLPIILILAGIILLSAGCIATSPPVPGKEVVKIAVQPLYSLHIMSQKYSPLVTYLSETTGYEMRMVAAMNYDSYLPTLESNQVHIGIQNPLAYVTVAKTRGAYPLVKMVQPDGTTSYRGVIISNSQSGIETLEDLEGKKVAASSRSAVAGFLGQAALCMENGIDINKDLSLTFVVTQDAVINAVYKGKAEAGFVREDALLLLANGINLEKLNIIAYTEYFPTWCVAAFENTSSEAAIEVRNALLSLDMANPEERAILEAMGISGFAPASDSDYNVIRDILDTLYLAY